jgi:hypothetical protein
MKQKEYKYLLKKASLLSYLLLHFKPDNLNNFISVYIHFDLLCNKGPTIFNQYAQRVADFDMIPFDALKIFVTQLTLYMCQNFISSDPLLRKDAYLSARVASLILLQFFDRKRSTHFKQFEVCF